LEEKRKTDIELIEERKNVRNLLSSDEHAEAL
jgi:hypothetical protein